MMNGPYGGLLLELPLDVARQSAPAVFDFYLDAAGWQERCPLQHALRRVAVSASDWAAGTSLSVYIASSHLLQEQQGARIAAGVLFDTEPNALAAC